MTRESIIIQGLVIPYSGKQINLELKKSLNYLKGNNGSGKTMLLDYIAGIRHQNSALIQGNESVVYINQNIFFSDRLSGKDFLKFVYQLDNIKNMTKYFNEYINHYYRINEDKTYIDKLMKKQWGMLSGGEKNFLYAVILLSLDREWYILDEPFAFVDENRKKILWEMILKKVKENKGVILSSHEEQEWIEQRADIIDITE